MNRKIVVGVLIVLAVLCACAVIAMVAAGAELFNWLSSEISQPFDARVAVTAPPNVEQGATFVIEVQIDSFSVEPQTLDSIDIALTYLEGVQILSTSPQYIDTYAMTLLLEQQTYLFDYSIPANGQVVVQLMAAALIPGDYSGQIDVCLNSVANCQSYMVRTIIAD